jgi:hypothetical protein
VTLTSMIHHRFRFSSCPIYWEQAYSGRAANSEFHYLNCRAVGTIAPGASVVFEIRMHIPKDIPLGNDLLQFDLGGDTVNPTNSVAARLVVGS